MSIETGTHELAAAPEPEWESLFPVGLESIVAVQQRLLQVTDEDVRSFVAVRRIGAADDPMTMLLASNFAEWHIEHHDFESDFAVAMYRAGKFYGAQLALDRYRETAGKKLVADDEIAYLAAKNAVFESYKYIETDNQWRKDFLREQRHLGGNTLALLNALLHDHISNQRYKIYQGNVPENETLESFYTGLLDAAIFINTYGRMHDQGKQPPRREFAVDIEKRRPLVYRLAQASIQEPVFGGIQMEFESSDIDPEGLLRQFSSQHGAQKRARMVLDGVEYRITAAQLLKQVGPNTFCPHNETTKIEQRPRLSTKQRALRLGGMAALGAAGTQVPDIWEYAPAAARVSAAIVGGAIGAWTGWTMKQAPWSQAETVWPPEPKG